MKPTQLASLHPEYAVLIIPQTQLRSLGNTMQIPNSTPSFSLASPNATHAVQQPEHRATTSEDQRAISLQIDASQLFTLEDAYIRRIQPPSESDLTSAPQSTRGRGPASTRRAVQTACIHCRRLAKRCDSARPCFRCVDMGREESCQDAPTKRRKSTREPKRSGPSALERPEMAATVIDSSMATLEVVPQPCSAHRTTWSAGPVNTGPVPAQAPDLSAATLLQATNGAWWPDAYDGPSTSQTSLTRQAEQSTSSLEAVNGDKGKGVDHPIQFAAIVDPTAMAQMTGYPTSSDYAVGTPMEPPCYFQPSFAPQTTKESLGLEDVQQYPNSWNSAGDSQPESSYQWGWRGY